MKYCISQNRTTPPLPSIICIQVLNYTLFPFCVTQACGQINFTQAKPCLVCKRLLLLCLCAFVPFHARAPFRKFILGTRCYMLGLGYTKVYPFTAMQSLCTLHYLAAFVLQCLSILTSQDQHLPYNFRSEHSPPALQ